MSERVRQPDVDEVDLRLLELLHQDARMSARALAREIGMSPGAVGERLQRLQEKGVIRGFRVEIDPTMLGLGLEVMVGLQLSQRTPLRETVKSLLEVPEVRSVYLVTGQWDLMVLIRVRDQIHLRETLLDRVWGIEDFRHGETMIVLEAQHAGDSLVFGARNGNDDEPE